LITEDDNYLFDFLDKDIEEAKQGIKAGNGLTQKGATAMLLKGMYNHIAHLDFELSDIRKVLNTFVTKADFNEFKVEINSKLNWSLGVMTFLICIVLPIILRYVK